MTDPPKESRLEIPFEQLSAAALLGVIDDYVLREGTHYGRDEVPLERLREQVMKQLRAGKALVIFDQTTNSCTIALRP